MGWWPKFVLWMFLAAFGAVAHATDVAILRNGFTIQHQRREALPNGCTRLYLTSEDSGYLDVLTSDIDHFEVEEALPPALSAGVPVQDLVQRAGHQHRIDPAFIRSVIRAESGFNPRATSPKGARGLMQLMPETAQKLGVQNAYDPALNVEAGTRYLSQLLDQYHGDAATALAAYNAGPQRVEQYHGLPPFRETQAYVARVIRDFNRQKREEAKQSRVRKKLPAKPTSAVPSAGGANIAAQQ